MDENSPEYLAFKKEQLIIFQKLQEETKEAAKLMKYPKGRDGPETVARYEAVQRYNKALKKLRLKYHLDEE